MKNLLLLVLLIISPSLFAELNGLKRLMEGNARYMKDALEHPNRTSESRQAYIHKQEPFAVIVGCADSRVAPEIIFDQGIGDLFVVRVAGNVIGSLELESIIYSAVYLHSNVILVLGHENCGAVNAVLDGQTHDIEKVAALIEPSVEKVRKQNPPNPLEASTKANAMEMRDFLLQTPLIQKLVQEKKIEVHAGYYHLKSGAVELL